MQHVGGGAAQRESPIHLIFLGLLFTPPKGRDRGAHRNVHQKATGIEGPYRDESGGNRGLHDHPHRPAGESAAALRALPAAMPEGAQRASAAGMARSIDAEIAVEAALPPTASRMSEGRGGGGGLSLGGAVGAGSQMCCLGGERYASGFRTQLVILVQRYGIRHVKLDG